MPTPSSTPQPAPARDGDGDGVVDASDRCPARRGALALAGCVPRAPGARARVRRRVVTLAVRADGNATLSVVVTRVGCAARGCTTRLRSAAGASGRATVRTGRLAAARYRITVRSSVQGFVSRPTGVEVRVR